MKHAIDDDNKVLSNVNLHSHKTSYTNFKSMSNQMEVRRSTQKVEPSQHTKTLYKTQ